MTQETLNITLLGVDAAERVSLLRVIQSLVSTHCRVVDSQQADVAIVNFERVSQRPSWARETTNLPLVVLATTEVRLPHAVCVVMPFEARDIKQAFATLQPLITLRRRSRQAQDRLGKDRLAQREVDALLTRKPTAYTRRAAALSAPGAEVEGSWLDPAESEKPPELNESQPQETYQPGDYLQSLVQGAIDESAATGSSVVVRGLGSDLVIFDHGSRAFTWLDEEQLRKLCKFPINPGSITFLYGNEEDVDTNALRGQSTATETLLWQLAAWCSNGRLPANAGLDRAISLTRFPNLTRLMRLPHSVRIASLWFAEPVSLRATAVLLDLPDRVIFQFYSACLQLGLIQEHRRRASVGSLKKQTSAGRGYLGRVMAYLGRLRSRAA